MFDAYRDIDLDDDPIIVPTCGHFLTISSMDGHVQLREHYEVENDVFVAPKDPEFILDSKQTQMRCPECRMSLRNLDRYGRVARRGLLIESTLKFITSSNREYQPLFDDLIRQAERFEETREMCKSQPVDMVISPENSMDINKLKSIVQCFDTRYLKLKQVYRRIQEYKHSVRVREQPFQRVKELVQVARRRSLTKGEFSFDQSILQTRAHTLAWALLRRCELIFYSDLLALYRNALTGGLNISIDFSASREDCENLAERAAEGDHVLQQVEAYLFWARFAALELGFVDEE